MPEDFVAVTGVSKSFGDNIAVDSMSFTVKKGEVFGLLGPNGAGKTTILRILSTVIPPDSGDIRVGGSSVKSEPWKVRAMLGVCPQNLAIYEDLTGLENLIFFARMSGLSGTDARRNAAEFLEVVGLTGRGKDLAGRYSGGMKRRLNIAIALVARPQIVLLDEPTVGVDPQSRNHIFETVERLNRGGMTVIYTTHYMEEADRLCRRILIMDVGKVVRKGTPAELKAEIGDPAKVSLEDVFLRLTGKSLRG